jgi:hypothetical protein
VRRNHDLFGRTTAVLADFGERRHQCGARNRGSVDPSGYGITIAKSPTHQGIHDRLAGGTYVARRLPSSAID